MTTLSPNPTPEDDLLEPLSPSEGWGISWLGVMMGLIGGVALGLFYAWQIDPVVVRNTAPSDLRPEDQQAYIVAAVWEYTEEQDLQQVVLRLLEVDPNGNPFELAAQTACNLIRSGQVNDLGDIEVIRTLRTIYEPQGIAAPCDVQAFNTAVPVVIIPPTPTITFTPSLTPVATKTPTKAVDPAPVNTPIPTLTPAAANAGGFQEWFLETYCDPNNAGILEVYVRDSNSVGLAGMPIEVVDSERKSAVFYSGLKPERGDDYADFQMAAAQSYRVGVQGQGSLSRPLDAIPCDGEGTLISYRVVLQRVTPEEP